MKLTRENVIKSLEEGNEVHGRGWANAMTPLNWMCGICELIVTPAGAFNHDNWFGIFCSIMFVIILFIYVGIYIYWMIK